ncbi:MAG: tandem-95 repeat protein, partial [Betaproteobacteria bacterium]
SSTATLMIDVNSVNDAPTPITGARFDPIGNEDQEIRIAESALVKMFSDADGDALSIDSDSIQALSAGDYVRFDDTRRELVFRAPANANGRRELSVKVTDGALTSTALTIGIMLRPVNDAPTVNAVGFQMLEDGGANNPTESHWSYLSHKLLLSGASDIEGDQLTVIKITGAQTAGVSNPQPVEVFNDLANQRIGLRAPLNYTGAIVFDFTVSDGQGGETTQRAYGSVAAVNEVPFLTAQLSSVNAARFGRTTLAELSSWQISAWDPDADQPTQISVVRNPLHGSVNIEGISASPDPRGGSLTSASVTSFSGFGMNSSNETVWFAATDSAGASSQINISFTGHFSADPIVIDLGRDGFSFMDIDQSRVSFNVNGEQRRSAWIGPNEGILAYDADVDGRIQKLEEITFGSYAGDPTLSDLQALQRPFFDQNQDGMFDRNDARWSNFFLWRDANSNGVSDTGELVNLNAAGIQALYLNANVLNRAEGADVRVRGYTRVLMNDGRLLQAADVWLGLDHPDRHNGIMPDPSMQQVSLLGSDQFSQLLKQLAEAPQRGNRAPLVYGYLPTQFAAEDQAFQLAITPNFFIDADTADPVSIAARLVDGSPLPAWLKWDPARLSFYGVPRVSDVGRLQLALIATDRQGASTQTSFTLATSAINRAPALNPAFSNLDWKISQSNQFKIPDNLFIDPNQDDALRYQLTMADGTQLPEWLRFDPISNTIISQPALASMFKPIQLKLTAVDLGGLSNSAALSVVTPTTGTNGDDNLWGSAADDILRGFSGNDILDAKGGNDQLSGGSGEDTLIGGASSDTYVFDAGWGWDEIRETASPTDRNVIRFTEGIRPSDIRLSRDLTSLNARNILTNDFISIHTNDSSGSPSYQSGLISSIQFARGEVWSALSDQDIVFEGILDSAHTNFTGSAKDDLIWASRLGSTVQGGLGNDMLFGHNGADQLFGGLGNDVLDGGLGDDLLAGELGDDVYRISAGSGNKTVHDIGGIDTLELHGVYSRTDLTLSRSGVDLITGFRNAKGSVTVKNFFGTDGAVNTTPPIDWFQFDNGSKISASGLLPSIELTRPGSNLGGFLNYTAPIR